VLKQTIYNPTKLHIYSFLQDFIYSVDDSNFEFLSICTMLMTTHQET